MRYDSPFVIPINSKQIQANSKNIIVIKQQQDRISFSSQNTGSTVGHSGQTENIFPQKTEVFSAVHLIFYSNGTHFRTKLSPPLPPDSSLLCMGSVLLPSPKKKSLTLNLIQHDNLFWNIPEKWR